MPNCMSMMQSPGTLPEKLAAREKVMSVRLEALRKLKTAVEPLYAALTKRRSEKDGRPVDDRPDGNNGVGMM